MRNVAQLPASSPMMISSSRAATSLLPCATARAVPMPSGHSARPRQQSGASGSRMAMTRVTSSASPSRASPGGPSRGTAQFLDPCGKLRIAQPAAQPYSTALQRTAFSAGSGSIASA